jgi:adenylate cyclase
MRVVAFDSDPAGDVTNLGELGRRLHVQYVVAGNVLRSGQGFTVSLQLIDATGGAQVWSHQDTLQVSDLAFESSVKFENVTWRVRTAIVSAEMHRVLGQPMSVLGADELVLRALATWKKESTLPGALEAHRLADRALELDPDLVSALLTRVFMMDLEYGLDPKADRRRTAREIDNDTSRAVKLDPANETAWAWRAIAQLYLGRWDAAPEAIDRALELDPENPQLLGFRALILNETGNPAEALAAIDRVRAAMDPNDAAYAALIECHSYLLLGQPERAAAMGEKCAIFARGWSVNELLVAAYANQGDWTKATAAKAELLRFVPGFTVAQARGYDEPAHPGYAKLAEKYIYDGLRKAGIPEQ